MNSFKDFVVKLNCFSNKQHPSKSEVIGRCGGAKKTNVHTEPTKGQTLKLISFSSGVPCITNIAVTLIQ